MHLFISMCIYLFVYFCTLVPDMLQLNMHQLNEIVVPRIQAKWEAVTFSMGYKLYDVDAIKEDCHHDTEKCCERLLSKWLRTSKHPTWSKLLKYIKDIKNLVAAAEEIEKLVSGS